MNSNKRHKKAGLSGNDNCRVVFRPDCGALKMHFGASTMQSLHILNK
ncbi:MULTISPECIES: hypothetical protein [Methylobacter]|nr:hypothetical protein [Methylobacter tundripaludum]